MNTEKIWGVLVSIENFACLGHGSENPEHWEAALEDILDEVRSVLKDGAI